MAAAEPPANAGLPAAQFKLFPTVEEQIENIAQAQAEERQAVQQQIIVPAGQVPEAVIGRALTSGSNGQHSIEHIVAFFQKEPTGSAAASFMEKEFKEGGKGVNIAGQDYALWFSREGFRIAPGRSAFGPGSTLVPWVNAAAMVSNLLRDGMFATQDRIDSARDNEFRELASTLLDLRRDFNERAENRGELPSIKEAFKVSGFPESRARIEELLRNSETRQSICAELLDFANTDSKRFPLLRFKHSPDPHDLYQRIKDMDQPIKQFQAVDGFAPVKGKFVTEDEIDRTIAGGPHVSESKLQIYAYFVQGHDAKECADYLKKSYGDGGYCYTGYDEWHDTKGIRLSRSDDFSDGKYDTAALNWNQVQKRVRALIDSGRYLNEQEKEYLPAYEKRVFARKAATFFDYDPNRAREEPWDRQEAEQKYLSLLEDPEKRIGLLGDMGRIFAVVPPDSREAQIMGPILQEMARFLHGDYSLFSPMPEDMLQAERQAKQAAKERKVEQNPIGQGATRTISEAPTAPGDRLAVAARALAKKKPAAVQEDQDGQFNLFSMPSAAPVEAEQSTSVPEPAAPSPAPEAAALSNEWEPAADSRSAWWDGYQEIKGANPDSIVLYQVGDFLEMYGEDAKTAAAVLDLNLATRSIAGAGRVEMCGIPTHNLQLYVDKLLESHPVTLALFDAREGKHKTTTMQPNEPEHTPTVRELYEHYKPIVKSLVLADEAYKNACINSDRENAYLEGNEAVKRAARDGAGPTGMNTAAPQTAAPSKRSGMPALCTISAARLCGN